MKRILPSLLICILLVHFLSCEKDDICVDGDTPMLIIGFYDAADTEEFKTVPSLRINSLDIDTVLENEFFNDRADSPDSLFVPLRIAETSTAYEFIMDSAEDADTGEETGNSDALTINYGVRETYISKACGFVANFENLSITLPDSAENWIQDISIVQETIENSNTIHVKIFH
nr:DUF6452 family protein [Allomuricauda sp.]